MMPLRFVPYHETDGIPNVVVDGSPNESTRLTLSHWPGSPTPEELLDDLSAQIAFRAADNPAWFDGISVVTNNHFDQDGLCSAYALAEPDTAAARRELVIDVAAAGDFGTFQSRDSIRLAFAIAAHEDASTSPLDAATFAGTYPEQCGRLYEEMLPRLTELLDHPQRSKRLWEAEDAHLTESLQAVADGTIRVDEQPALDLAVFSIPASWAERTTSRFTQQRVDAVHPVALNQSTGAFRVVTLQGDRYRLECRYETWVMYRSRPVMPRPDLRLLAERLNEIEPGEQTWVGESPAALTPSVSTSGGGSGLSPEQFLGTVTDFLATAPGAWDPYARR